MKDDMALHILQLNTSDEGGGAERVVWNLYRSYLEHGYQASVAVGKRRSVDPGIIALESDAYRNRWAKFWISVANTASPLLKKLQGGWRLYDFLCYGMGQTGRWLRSQRGYEDFDFPATWHLLDLLPCLPDIIHCHNLHGGYFDLRALPLLSHRFPIVLTLHDAWLLSGHCSHAIDCSRWKTGCGHCPDLSVFPPIRRDATAYNWRRKEQIYGQSRLYLATPCKWLREKVKKSIIARAVKEYRVISNGVDLSLFYPDNKAKARILLGIPMKARVVLFTARRIKKNDWKDYQTLRSALIRAAHQMPGEEVILLALGEDGPSERIGRLEIRYIPYQKEPKTVASYYRSADIYVQASHADTFPNTILEAFACGIPVVATVVGGIPEQVKSMAHGHKRTEHSTYQADQATGVLVPPADAEAMASAIGWLFQDELLRQKLGENAFRDAKNRFNLQRQAGAYLRWYKEIIFNWR
jgi:glycosyltransferase involved in cell wall biosynthesis